MYERVVWISVGEFDKGVVERSGDDRRGVNRDGGPYQRLVVLISNRARLGYAGRERPVRIAWGHHPVGSEVYEAGLKQKRPVSAERRGARGITGVRQFLGKVHTQAVGLRLVAGIEDDVPRRL